MANILKNLKDFLFSFLLIGSSLFFTVIEVQDIISDIDFVKNGTYTIATIQKVTQLTSAGRHSKEKYSIEVSFVQNSETSTGTFVTTKSFADKVGAYFDTKFRVGNKITIIVNKNGKIKNYSDRKSIFFEDAQLLAFNLILFSLGFFLLIHSIKSLKRQKTSFYFQEKNFKIKNLDVYSVSVTDYLKKIEDGEIICFGFTVAGGFCEYSYKDNIYFERVDDGNGEVTHEITERSIVLKRIGEISSIARKYT